MRCLSYGHNIVFTQYFPVHLLEKFMYSRSICTSGIITSVSFILNHRPVRKTLIFRKKRNYIHPESIDSFIQPEPQDIIYFLPHFRIFPVQIRLLFCKAVQIILGTLLCILPGRSAEAGSPVIDYFVFPYIVVAVRIVLTFS